MLELWSHCAGLLRVMGYGVWTGILSSERYGIVRPCPLHESHASDAGKSSSSRNGTGPDCAGSAATTDPAESGAWSAENRSRFARSLGFALSHAEMRDDYAATELALVVVLRSRASIGAAIAPGATPQERLRLLAQRAREARATQTGRAAGEWTSVAMSECGWEADTAESIGLWLSSYLAAPSLAKKWFTTSTGTRLTTIRQILRSIAATLITWPHTGPANRTAGCGLCVEVATPQTRKRAILMASLDSPVHPPRPTHQAYVPGEPARHEHTLEGEMILPWISMAEALEGDLWPEIPAPTVTAGGAGSGGIETFGRGGRRRINRATAEREARA